MVSQLVRAIAGMGQRLSGFAAAPAHHTTAYNGARQPVGLRAAVRGCSGCYSLGLQQPWSSLATHMLTLEVPPPPPPPPPLFCYVVDALLC